MTHSWRETVACLTYTQVSDIVRKQTNFLWKSSPQGMTTHDSMGKRPCNSADIRLISLLSGSWIRSKHGCFERFFIFLKIRLTFIDILLISRYIHQIFFSFYETCQILNWNSVNFLLISVWYTSYIRLVYWVISRYQVYLQYRFPPRCCINMKKNPQRPSFFYIIFLGKWSYNCLIDIWLKFYGH